jgi:hypothetical protein
MRRREAESIVDDIINELRYMPIFEEDFEHLENTNGLHHLRCTLIKIVMDEE